VSARPGEAGRTPPCAMHEFHGRSLGHGVRCAGYDRMRLDRFILGLAALLSPSIGVAAEAPGGPASSGAAPCSYFVATTGSDRNDGMSAATPFASLEKAQAAVRRASKKVVCLR